MCLDGNLTPNGIPIAKITIVCSYNCFLCDYNLCSVCGEKAATAKRKLSGSVSSSRR